MGRTRISILKGMWIVLIREVGTKMAGCLRIIKMEIGVMIKKARAEALARMRRVLGKEAGVLARIRALANLRRVGRVLVQTRTSTRNSTITLRMRSMNWMRISTSSSYLKRTKGLALK